MSQSKTQPSAIKKAQTAKLAKAGKLLGALGVISAAHQSMAAEQDPVQARTDTPETADTPIAFEPESTKQEHVPQGQEASASQARVTDSDGALDIVAEDLNAAIVAAAISLAHSQEQEAASASAPAIDSAMFAQGGSEAASEDVADTSDQAPAAPAAAALVSPLALGALAAVGIGGAAAAKKDNTAANNAPPVAIENSKENPNPDAPPQPAQGESGVVADGYVKGATVFRDANGNGIKDADEFSVTTDDKGKFTNLQGTGGKLVAQGGIDISTGKAFVGSLEAVAGQGGVINPLTTVVSAVAGDVSGLSAQEAAAKIAAAAQLTATALNLPPSFDPSALYKTDALAAATASGSDSTAQMLQKSAIGIANVIAVSSQLLASSGAAPTTSAQAIKDALAQAVSSGNADLTKADGVAKVLNTAVASAERTENKDLVSDALVNSVATATANVNAAVASAPNGLAGSVAAQLSVTGDGGLLSEITKIVGTPSGTSEPTNGTIDLSKFSSDAINAAINDNLDKVGDIDGDGVNDGVVEGTATASAQFAQADALGIDTIDAVASLDRLGQPGHVGHYGAQGHGTHADEFASALSELINRFDSSAAQASRDVGGVDAPHAATGAVSAALDVGQSSTQFDLIERIALLGSLDNDDHQKA